MFKDYGAPPIRNRLDELIDPSWLDANAEELTELSCEVMNKVIVFTFLWMIFEGRALKEHGGVEKIKEECKKWADGGCICDNTFSYELNYFRKRYINCESRSKNNDFKELFGDHLGTAYCRDTEEFLLGKRHSPEINALTVLYVVYRYRNNLFHGPKWIRNEYHHNFEVFTYANCILMKALRFHQLTSSADG